VHRTGCKSFIELARRSPERVLETTWGTASQVAAEPRRAGSPPLPVYPAEVMVRARDRQGLLRDVSDVFARDRLNVVAVRTLSRDGQAQMQFTVEVASLEQLNRTLATLRAVEGVMQSGRV
jgi:GTP pyrophosphokinase